jgi:thiamine pyrophosphate-dependent acetolactate synthase large subunit-like protein
MNILDGTRTVLERNPDALFVAALGTVTAALRDVSEDGPHLYFGGAMGAAAAAALGVAERVAPRRVVALVGDGEMLMSARTLWTVAGVRPRNLLVVVMADGHYTQTGGQPIEAAATFAEAASAIPGLASARAASRDELARALDAIELPGLIEVAVDERVRPVASPFVDPHRVRLAFEAEIARGAAAARGARTAARGGVGSSGRRRAVEVG